jgi:hypothetical protein
MVWRLFPSFLAGATIMASRHLDLGKAFRRGWWCLALAVLLCGLSGCKTWNTHDEGLRNPEMSEGFRKARAIKKKDLEKDVKKKDSYDPFMSEEANEIKQNLE